MAYDFDDVATIGVIDSLKYPWLKFHGRNRSGYIQRDYHNWLYSKSTGRFIIVINDDTLFRTKEWDVLAIKKLDVYLQDKPDNIVYGWISDSLLERERGINYCCFPLISRAAAQILGYVMHNAFHGWGADIHLYELFHSIGRVLDLREVWIDHISYHSDTSIPRDNTSLHTQSISGVDPFINMNEDRRKLMTSIQSIRRLVLRIRKLKRGER